MHSNSFYDHLDGNGNGNAMWKIQEIQQMQSPNMVPMQPQIPSVYPSPNIQGISSRKSMHEMSQMNGSVIRGRDSWTHLPTDVAPTAFGSPSVTIPNVAQSQHHRMSGVLCPPSMPSMPVVPEEVAPRIVPIMDHLDLSALPMDKNHAKNQSLNTLGLSRLSEITPSLPGGITMEDDEDQEMESTTASEDDDFDEDEDEDDDEMTSLKPQNTGRGGKERMTFPERKVGDDENGQYTALRPQNIHI